MLGFTMAIDQSESRTQACHVRIEAHTREFMAVASSHYSNMTRMCP